MQESDILKDYRDDWVWSVLNMPGFDYRLFDGRSVIWIYNGEDCLTAAMREILSRIRLEKGAAFEQYAIDISMSEEDRPAISDDVWMRSVMLIWDIAGHNIFQNVMPPVKDFSGDILYVYDTRPSDIPITGKVRYLSCPEIFGAGYERDFLGKENYPFTSVPDFFGHQIYMLSRISEMMPGTYGQSVSAPLLQDDYSLLITPEDNVYMYDFWINNPDRRFYFDNTYNGDLLLLQQLLYMCLEEFDRICRENNIRYFLGGGSLLGAVRHQGIIPWDDDVDVMMLRGDYERFIEVAPKAVKEGMFFQSSDTDSEYHSVFPKLRIDGTRFVTEFSSRFHNMHQGIFIDIFVHDHTSDNRLMQKLHIFETLFARSMVFHKWEGTPMHFYGKHKLICRLATKYVRKTSMEKLERIQDKVIRKYNKKNTSYLYDGTGEHIRHGAFPAAWLSGTAYETFGGKEYPIPCEAGKYLEFSYGEDYMDWPSAGRRKGGHNIIEVDFGKYKKEKG